MAVEIEITLVVAALEPAAVMGRIAALERIGPYRLDPGTTLALDDRYYDTGQGALAKHNLALRLRRVAERTVVGLKGDELTDAYGITRRSEIEGPWSPQLRQEIGRALADHGIDLPGTSGDDIESALAAWGMRVIQDRETTRQIRIASLDPARPLAEIALDRVTYHPADGPVVHCEIEIEALGPEGEKHLAALAGALQVLEPLKPWPHNKLATGLALDILSSQGYQPSACLTPDWLDLVARTLGAKKEKPSD